VKRYGLASVLVLGCAMGYSVKALRGIGCDASGLDISEFALSRAPADVRSYLHLGDVRNPAAYRWADSIIDENVLPYMSDDEAVRVCGYMRDFSNVVVHRLSVHPVSSGSHIVRPLSEWRAICDPNGLDRWHVYTTWGDE
jgi:hypothetical protein